MVIVGANTRDVAAGAKPDRNDKPLEHVQHGISEAFRVLPCL